MSSFKELLKLLSWNAHFPKLPKEAFKFKDTWKDIPILSNWFLQKQRPWAVRGYHDRPQNLSGLLKKLWNQVFKPDLRARRDIKTYPWWTNYAQVSALEWPNIFTSHNAKGIYTSFTSLPYYFTHLCTSCSWAMQYVGVFLRAQWPHTWAFIAFPCLPQPLDQRTGVWRGGIAEHC